MQAARWDASSSFLSSRGFEPTEGNSSLLPFQVDEGEDDYDPVEHIGEDTAERGGVVPTEDSIEDLNLESRELSAIRGWKVVTYLPSTVGSRGAGLSSCQCWLRSGGACVTHLWVAVGQVPDVAGGPVGSWTITGLGDITSDALGKGVVLEVSDTLRGESGADQEEEGGRADQEPVEGGGRSSLVDQPSYFFGQRSIRLWRNWRTHRQCLHIEGQRQQG